MSPFLWKGVIVAQRDWKLHYKNEGSQNQTVTVWIEKARLQRTTIRPHSKHQLLLALALGGVNCLAIHVQTGFVEHF